MSSVIAIVSGKGGVGKTSLCGGVGSCLAAMGKRVLCMDLDMGLRNLDLTLGLADMAVMDFTDVLSRRCTLNDAVVEHPEIPGLFLLTCPLGQSAESVDPGRFAGLISDIRRNFDYCLLDAPAGIGRGLKLAAMQASAAIVLTTVDASAQRGAAAASRELKKAGVTDQALVINRVDTRVVKKLGQTLDDVIDFVSLPLIGVVPDDRQVILSGSGSKPLMLFARKKAISAYANIARRLEGQRVPLLSRR